MYLGPEARRYEEKEATAAGRLNRMKQKDGRNRRFFRIETEVEARVRLDGTTQMTGHLQLPTASEPTLQQHAAKLKQVDDLKVRGLFNENVINGSKMKDATITGGKIGDDQITQTNMASNSVGNPQIRAGAVDTDELALGAVNTPQLANSSVNEFKIEAGVISSTHISASLKNGVSTRETMRSLAGTGNSLAAAHSDVTGSISYRYLPKTQRDFIRNRRSQVRTIRDQRLSGFVSGDWKGYEGLFLCDLILAVSHLVIDNPELTADEWEAKLISDAAYKSEYIAESEAHMYYGEEEPGPKLLDRWELFPHIDVGGSFFG